MKFSKEKWLDGGNRWRGSVWGLLEAYTEELPRGMKVKLRLKQVSEQQGGRPRMFT